eukprot:6097637-Prymnesium_polylepis.1
MQLLCYEPTGFTATDPLALRAEFIAMSNEQRCGWHNEAAGAQRSSSRVDPAGVMSRVLVCRPSFGNTKEPHVPLVREKVTHCGADT